MFLCPWCCIVFAKEPSGYSTVRLPSFCVICYTICKEFRINSGQSRVNYPQEGQHDLRNIHMVTPDSKEININYQQEKYDIGNGIKN